MIYRESFRRWASVACNLIPLVMSSESREFCCWQLPILSALAFLIHFARLSVDCVSLSRLIDGNTCSFKLHLLHLHSEHKNSRQHRQSGEHDNRTTDFDVNLFLLLLLQLHVAASTRFRFICFDCVQCVQSITRHRVWQLCEPSPLRVGNKLSKTSAAAAACCSFPSDANCSVAQKHMSLPIADRHAFISMDLQRKKVLEIANKQPLWALINFKCCQLLLWLHTWTTTIDWRCLD